MKKILFALVALVVLSCYVAMAETVTTENAACSARIEFGVLRLSALVGNVRDDYLFQDTQISIDSAYPVEETVFAEARLTENGLLYRPVGSDENIFAKNCCTEDVQKKLTIGLSEEVKDVVKNYCIENK